MTRANAEHQRLRLFLETLAGTVGAHRPRIRRSSESWARGVLCAIFAAALGVAGAPPAEADSSLCNRPDYGCVSFSGYTGNSVWGSFGPGHNCVSYAAYRLSRNGATQPWSSPIGNAFEWDEKASAAGIRVDKIPTVGSIAQWDTNSGHVAYVESATDGSITVSEDSFSGYSSRRQLDRNGAAFREADFIHIKDQALPSGTEWNGVGDAAYFGSNQLTPGQTLTRNQYISSRNGLYALVFQNDGNLVLYHGRSFIWNSSTGGRGATRASMQADGNLVLYRSDNTWVWQSSTGGTASPTTVLQDDGNIVIYSSNTSAVWQSGTSGNGAISPLGAPQLSAGEQLRLNQYAQSDDHRYTLLLQADGNLVIYGPGYHVLWSSGTSGSQATRLSMQTDGNAVLYRDNNSWVWQTGTGGTSANRLVVQSDGNVVLYRPDNSWAWQSATNGRI